MTYVLLIFFTLAGHPHMEQIEQPSWTDCLRAKQVWLHHARAQKLEGAEAYCVGKRPL